MGLETATEALRWGVNDLGGTLMEESISRLAGSQHGTKLDPDQLVAAAHAAGRPAAERTTLYEDTSAFRRPCSGVESWQMPCETAHFNPADSGALVAASLSCPVCLSSAVRWSLDGGRYDRTGTVRLHDVWSRT